MKGARWRKVYPLQNVPRSPTLPSPQGPGTEGPREESILLLLVIPTLLSRPSKCSKKKKDLLYLICSYLMFHLQHWGFQGGVGKF
jgi:hypothetical protein